MRIETLKQRIENAKTKIQKKRDTIVKKQEWIEKKRKKFETASEQEQRFILWDIGDRRKVCVKVNNRLPFKQ